MALAHTKSKTPRQDTVFSKEVPVKGTSLGRRTVDGGDVLPIIPFSPTDRMDFEGMSGRHKRKP